MLDLDLDTLYAKIDSDRDFKNFYLTLRYEFNQGGVVPAHEAGIYGLAEGGQLVKPGPGRQGYNGWESEFSTDWGGEAEPQGSPPGTDPGPGIVTESGGDASIAEQIAAQDRNRRQDLSDIITRGEAEKTEEWEKSKEAPWNKPTVTIGGMAVNLLTFALTGGIDNPLTRQAASKLVKWGADKIGFEDTINTFVGENFGSIDEMKARIEEKVARQDLIQSLPRGHPERIQLEGLTKETIIPERDNGRIQETGITYANIEDTNRKELASAEARQIQEKVDRSKQDAYYAAFRQQYLMGDTEEPQTMFVAQGGRVPGGYNTGGLSNLFRLKNI